MYGCVTNECTHDLSTCKPTSHFSYSRLPPTLCAPIHTHTHTHIHTHTPSTVPELNLDYIVDNPWLVIPISGLRQINIDQVIDWLVKQAR